MSAGRKPHGVARSRYLTTGDIAEQLQISRSQAHRIALKLLHYRDGRIIRVPRAAFEGYLRQQERQGWQADSTSEARFGGVGSSTQMGTAATVPRDSKTRKPPELSCVSSNDELPIQPTQPRTRPRLVKRSKA